MNASFPTLLLLLLLATCFVQCSAGTLLHSHGCTQDGRDADRLVIGVVECRYTLPTAHTAAFTARLHAAGGIQLPYDIVAIATDDDQQLGKFVHANNSSGRFVMNDATHDFVVAFEFANCDADGVPLYLTVQLADDPHIAHTSRFSQPLVCDKALAIGDGADHTFPLLTIYVLFAVLLFCIICIYNTPDETIKSA